MGINELMMETIRAEVLDDVDVTLAMELCRFLDIGDEPTLSYLRGRVMGDIPRNPLFNWDALTKEIVSSLRQRSLRITCGERYANGSIPFHIVNAEGAILKSFKLFHQTMVK